MSTLTSSVINKSSKKIAPKAAVQRRQVPTPASTQPSQRASVERQGQPQLSGRNQENAVESSAPFASSPPPIRLPATGEDRNEPAREPARESITIQSGRQSNEIANEVTPDRPDATTRTDLAQVPSTSVIPIPSDTQSGLPENAVDVPASVTPTFGVRSSEDADSGEASSKRRRIEEAAIEVEAPAATSDTQALGVPTVEASTQTAEHDTQLLQIASTPARPTRTVEVVIQRNQTTSTTGHRASSAAQPASVKGKRKGKGAAKSTTKNGNATAHSSQTKTRRKRATSTNVKPREPRKRKEPDTEDENAEIIPSQVKMVDLCKDSGKGQTSQRERELANMDWEAVVRKQRERQAQEEQGETPPGETVDQALERAGREREASTRARAGIKLRLVNGQMVVDDQSLRVDRHANAAAEAEAETLEEVEENDLTRRVTSGSWMKREKIEPWDEDLTDRFYEGLRMFGTDFMIISKMFPGRTRRQIKLKFTREERQDPVRVKEALTGPRIPMDLTFLSQLSNVEYEDPRQFHEELEREARDHAEEMKRQEEQAEEVLRQRRAEKLAAAMTGDDSPEAAGENNSSAKENNNHQHVGGGNAAGKRKRGGKKQADTARKKMFSRHGGGEELEIVGTIEG